MIDQFLNGFDQTLARMPHNTLVRSGIRALKSGILQSQKFYFADSSMRMLMDKWQQYEQTCQQIKHLPALVPAARGVWYEFCEPVESIRALYVWKPSIYLDTGKDRYQLVLIRQNSDIAMIAEAFENEAWMPQFAEQYCKSKSCRPGQPCESCVMQLAMCSEILVLCSIIAGQQLATFSYVEQEFHGMRHEQRQHSNKVRRIPSKHLFRVIDACEIVVPIRSPHSAEKHGSWLDGTEIRVEIQTRPFSRTYRHERYKNVRGQTVEFEKGIRRMQPMKKENLERSLTKVKASDYEGREIQR